MTTKPKLDDVERALAWCAQHGYVFAERAAAQLGAITGREMYLDQPYYNAWSWREQMPLTSAPRKEGAT